jgi:CBS domain-containing protein
VIDSTANAAFFFGLLSGFSKEYGNPRGLLDFSDVSSNFLSAARLGLGAQFIWLGNRTIPAQELIIKELIPLAREGLRNRKVNQEDIDRYLGVLEERVQTQKTGSEWILSSFNSMRNQGSRSERLAAITAGAVKRQATGDPVHTWDVASLDEAGGWKPNYMRVDQFMRTDLVTVSEDDTLELVANLMDWEKIRHILVEDSQHRLIGLLSYRAILRYYGKHGSEGAGKTVHVRDIMKLDPITVSPETSTVKAIEIMRRGKVGCLPVVQGDRLIGMVTEREFMDIARQVPILSFAGNCPFVDFSEYCRDDLLSVKISRAQSSHEKDSFTQSANLRFLRIRFLAKAVRSSASRWLSAKPCRASAFRFPRSVSLLYLRPAWLAYGLLGVREVSSHRSR